MRTVGGGISSGRGTSLCERQAVRWAITATKFRLFGASECRSVRRWGERRQMEKVGPVTRALCAPERVRGYLMRH